MKSTSAFTSSNDHVPTDVFLKSGCQLELSHLGDCSFSLKEILFGRQGVPRSIFHSITEGSVAGSAINASTASAS